MTSSSLQDHAAGMVYQTRIDNGEWDHEELEERNPEAFKSQLRTEFLNWLGDSTRERLDGYEERTKNSHLVQYLCQWLNEELPDYAFFFTEVVN